MQPEKPNLWDRLFNRYRKTIKSQGSETWIRRFHTNGFETSQFEYKRDYVVYTITDRVTGSETIKKEYLD